MPDKHIALDSEVLDLFRDDPSALAIADAIAATRRRPPRRLAPRAVAIAAAAAIVAVTVAVIHTSDSQAGVVKKALEAIRSDGPIVLTLRDDREAGTVITANGHQQSVHHVIREWFNSHTGARRILDTMGGIPVSDTRIRTRVKELDTAAALSTAALAAFPSLYETGLRSATETSAHRGVLQGVDIYWFEFPDSAPLVKVAIDARTYIPKLIIFRSDYGSRRFSVVKLVREPSTALDQPRQVPALVREVGVRRRVSNSSPALKSSFAHAALAQRARYRFARCYVVRFGANNGFEFHVVTHGRGLRTRIVVVQESDRAESSFGWTPARISLANEEGSIFVERTGVVVSAYLRSRHRFLRITTTGGAGVTEQIAHQLASID